MIGVLLTVLGLAISYFHWSGIVISFTGIGTLSRSFSKTLLLWLIAALSISAAFLLQLPHHARISELTAISFGIFSILSFISTLFGYSISVELRKS